MGITGDASYHPKIANSLIIVAYRSQCETMEHMVDMEHHGTKHHGDETN